MGFRINTNIAAMNAHRNASQNNVGLDKSLNSLSSGLRINKAADDASGLAIANQLSAQSSGLGQAIRNSNDGIAMIQTADGALEETGNILKRIRTLSVQSANDTQTTASRAYIQEEVDALTEQLDDIASRTSFNGQQLLDGTGGSTQVAQSGVHGTAPVLGVFTLDLTGIVLGNAVAADSFEISGVTAYTGTIGVADNATTIAAGIDGNTITIGGADYLIDATDITAVTLTQTTATTTAGSVGIGVTDNGTVDATQPNNTVATETTAGVTEVVDTYVAASGSFNFHSGAYSNETTAVTIGSASADALNVATIDVSTAAGAELGIAAADAGIVAVDTLRSTLGAAQNKLESNVRNISVTQVNVSAAESNIRDVDFAAESANFAKHNILAQSGSYAMSQANAVQQNVMRLLQ